MRILSLNLSSHPVIPQFSKQASILLSTSRVRFNLPFRHGVSDCCYSYKLQGLNVGNNECRLLDGVKPARAFDEVNVDSYDLGSFDGDGAVGHIVSSSDDESDGEYVLNPLTDLDVTSVTVSKEDALKLSSHRLALIGRGGKIHRIRHGMFINLGLITFLTVLLLFVDCCAWKIVRLPLPPFHLTSPFFISAAVVSFAGYIFVPVLDSLKIHQIYRKVGGQRPSKRRRTPTMGGLFFVPIGVAVAIAMVGFSSTEVSGAAVATLAFSAIGVLDDTLSLKNYHNRGLSAWLKLLLQIAVGSCFSIWLDTSSISSPYGIKMLVPLPAPLGLLCFGKFYLLLTSFCFVSMGNGVNLTDGLDGLAGGIAALTFVGMSIAILPICSDLAVFGASMAGACVGFLSHNRYRASIFMGETGSLAIGGALATMAACSGMFFPLFISSGIFVLEASSVIMQVWYYKTTKRFLGVGRRFFRMAPFHHHLELCGLREPFIVAGAYVVSCVLALSAGYVGLISA